MPKSTINKLPHFLRNLPLYQELKACLELNDVLVPIVEQHLQHILPSSVISTQRTQPDNQQPLIYNLALNRESTTKLQLNIACASSAIASQLRHSQARLLERINTEFDKSVQLQRLCANERISQLKFTVSPSAQGSALSEPSRLANDLNTATGSQTSNRSPSLTPEQVASLNAMSDEFSDPVLSASMKRLTALLRNDR